MMIDTNEKKRKKLATSVIIAAGLVSVGFWPVHFVARLRGKSCQALWERKMSKNASLTRSRRDTVDAAIRPSKAPTFQQRTVYDPFKPTYIRVIRNTAEGNCFGDGGKFVCGDADYYKMIHARGKQCLLYSVGSNGDTIFEQDIVKSF
jgi:hypothetical protein